VVADLMVAELVALALVVVVAAFVVVAVGRRPSFR
jgi:hypothetical protein